VLILSENTSNQNKEEDFRVRSNGKNWSLVAGALLIFAACILSYLLTRPAEADVSFLDEKLMSILIQSA